MNIDDAIRFVVDEVEDPALEHPYLEETYKNKVKRSKIIVNRIKKIGDLNRYLKRFEIVPPVGDPKRDLYDRFKELNLKTYEDLYSEFVQKFAPYIDDVTVLDDFVIGKDYTSWDISIFAQTYDTQSGIYLIGEEPNYQAIFVKATFEEGKYPNKWIEPNNLLKYYMYSARKVFNKDYKYNRAILNSNTTNTPIYVFQKEGTRLILKGIFRYEKDEYDPEDGSRWFILQKINTISTEKIMTEAEYNQEIQKLVNKSKRDSDSNRRQRLANADNVPDKLTVTSTQFKRNADVIAEVLKRADGVCEKCYKPAPFLRANDYTPYLEVHHLKPLAEGGEDTVKNAVALCPNCHREYHHAADVISVTAGIIIEDGKVLIAKRAGEDKLVGKWEFPGGKVKPNETYVRALRRELREELGIKVKVSKYLGESIYKYDSGVIRLMAFYVKRVAGAYELNVHEEMKFVPVNKLNGFDFLPADVPIVHKLIKNG
ncbi:5-methylcytosine-specific restriction enzyme A [Thalassobacillus cyri]|uniref:8-oxo-dGTP diphosphatase n=1 Tax=Thalassobacillus cyri TaxID=571932 RepID=A0A1H3VYG2_9BACI|nr:NUDIX domain-containing protein [Thalassobacillus cyri]SDZ79224.1 5-methylcytosine-specific restriction enzyme A [Thalassobacillus cyri]